IAAAVTVGPRIVERLRDQDVEPAEIAALADRYAPDAPLFALALAGLEPLHAYFRGLRDVRLEGSGTHLADPGLAESPQLGGPRETGGELPGSLRSRPARAGGRAGWRPRRWALDRRAGPAGPCAQRRLPADRARPRERLHARGLRSPRGSYRAARRHPRGRRH